MKVVTVNLWNVNSSWIDRCEVFNSLLLDEDPDILFLQEVSRYGDDQHLQFEDFLPELRCRRNSLYVKSGEWYGREEGLAILSAHPIKDSISISLPLAVNDMPRQILVAQVEYQGTKIFLANTHLAFALGGDRDRLHQVEACLNCLHGISTSGISNIIFAGDFNCAPSSLPIREILSDPFDFYDPFSQLNKLPGASTFCSSNPLADPKLGTDRWIDYIFLARSIKVLRAERVLIQPGTNGHWATDHFGLLTEVSFQ
jgi:endonuclease/exonuclease/phosphatase family metal-dependent hydrolase